MDLPEHLALRLDLALGNAPAQLDAGLDNAGIVIDLCSDPDTLATLASTLDDATARIAALRALIPDAPAQP